MCELSNRMNVALYNRNVVNVTGYIKSGAKGYRCRDEFLIINNSLIFEWVK